MTDQASVDAALAGIDHLDAVVHNAGHMVLGPAEAFTPEQLAELYDVNVVGTQRVNRAALPRLRAQGSGLLVWVGSSSTRGGVSADGDGDGGAVLGGTAAASSDEPDEGVGAAVLN